MWSKQLDLIQEPPPPLLRPAPTFRRSDPETSKTAAASMRANARAENARILAALARLPGRRGTYHEISAEADLTPPVRVHRRLGKRGGLVGAQLVRRTDEQRLLPTMRWGHVYRLAGGPS